MKKIIKRIIIIFSVVFTAMISTRDAYAAEMSPGAEEISAQVDEMLEDYDISYSYGDMSGLSIGEMISTIGESTEARVKAPVKLLGMILVIVVFSSFMKSAGESVFSKNSSANLYNLICVLSAVAVISPALLKAYENASSAIDRGGGFMLVFIPVYAGITVASGGITSAGIYNAVTLAAAEIMVQLSSTLLMPMLSMTAALAITGSVFPNTTLDSLVKLAKKLVTWGMTAAMTLFTGFISLKCTLGSTVDGFAAKTVKFMISGFVPVIGSAVSDAYSTVKGSFGVMRCTAGTAGTIAVVLIMLPPILELLIFRVVMWTGSTAAEMFSAEPLAKLLKSLDNGLAIAMSILVGFSVLFIISTAILMKTAM